MAIAFITFTHPLQMVNWRTYLTNGTMMSTRSPASSNCTSDCYRYPSSRSTSTSRSSTLSVSILGSAFTGQLRWLAPPHRGGRWTRSSGCLLLLSIQDGKTSTQIKSLTWSGTTWRCCLRRIITHWSTWWHTFTGQPRLCFMSFIARGVLNIRFHHSAFLRWFWFSNYDSVFTEWLFLQFNCNIWPNIAKKLAENNIWTQAKYLIWLVGHFQQYQILHALFDWTSIEYFVHFYLYYWCIIIYLDMPSSPNDVIHYHWKKSNF